MSILRSVNRPTRLVLLLLAMGAGSLLVNPALRADVTISYKSDFKAGGLLPSSMLQQMRANQKSMMPSTSVRQVKGDKEHSTMGGRDTLADFTTQQITLLDSMDKLYATVYMKDYLSELKTAIPAMPALPPQAMAILQTMKTSFATRKTGRTDMILGLPVEESEWTLTLQLPTTGLPLPPGAVPPGQDITLVKLIAEIWAPTADAAAHSAALTELVSHRSSISASLLNPTGALMEGLGNFPGLRDGLAPMMQELLKSPSVILKTHITVYLPVVAQFAPLAAAHGQKLPLDFNPDAPLGEMTVEATELSTAPIADSVFVVPSDYQPTSFPDLVKAMRPVPATVQRRGINPPVNPSVNPPANP